MAENRPQRVEHRRTSGNQAAVLFIHGFSGRPETTWAKFPELLAADQRLDGWDLYSLGYTTSIWLDLVGIWKADPSIPTLADALRTALGLAPLQRYRVLALVAHSMGGLVVQQALVDDTALAARTGFLFLFGTPSAGLTKAAFFKFWKRSIEYMVEGGPFITALRARWRERFGGAWPFKLWAVAGDQDEFVPRRSSIDPFPDSVRRVITGDHLSIVKPQTAEHLAVQLVLDGLAGAAAAIGPADSARRALEHRDFWDTIDRLGTVQGLDERGLVDLALALEGVGRPNDAIAVLQRDLRPEYLDATGVLAGRLKRRWRLEQRRADWQQARELYAYGFAQAEAAQRHCQAFYHGINVAFLDLAAGHQPQARVMAEKVLGHCAQPCADPAEERWRPATQGEAALLLGEPARAIEHYRAGARSPGVTPRQLDSMYQQAVQVASLIGDQTAAEHLEAIFRRGEL